MKRIQLALLDTAALETVTSKGLVRRAAKDLEKGLVKGIINESDSEIVIEAADARVTIPLDTPMKSRCTCPAPGFCRHIIAAVLFLQQQKTVQEEPPSSPAAAGSIDTFKKKLLDYPVKTLQKWGGKQSLKQALGLLSKPEAVNIEEENNKIFFRFPDPGVTVLAFPGIEPEDMPVSGAKGREKIFVLAAVLAFQEQRGKKIETLEIIPGAPTEKKGTPRNRKAVLETVINLLEEMVSVGLSHLSSAFFQRLSTLSIAAGGVHLPRLSLELRGIADGVQLLLNRDARANEANLLLQLSQTYALTTSLWQNPKNPPNHLVGQHRTHYEPVNQLALFVVSAYRWHTPSDYHGITLLMWHQDSDQWYSWSDSRPAFHQTGFDPVKVYNGDSPFHTACRFNELFGSRLQFLNARKNYQNRLSIGQETKVNITNRDSSFPGFDSRCFTRWSRLLEYSHRIMSSGLRGYNPLDEITVIKPARWGKKGFHSTEQVFYWQMEDDKGEELSLMVPFDPINRGSIEILEHFKPSWEKVSGIVGRLVHHKNHLCIYPLSLLRKKEKNKGPVINLTLDSSETIVPFYFLKTIRKELGALFPVISPGVSPGFFDEEEGLLISPYINPRIRVVQDDLQVLAESGSNGLTDQQRDTFKDHGVELENASYSLLAKHLFFLSEEKASQASLFLRTYYLCHLYQQAFARITR